MVGAQVIHSGVEWKVDIIGCKEAAATSLSLSQVLNSTKYYTKYSKLALIFGGRDGCTAEASGQWRTIGWRGLKST